MNNLHTQALRFSSIRFYPEYGSASDGSYTMKPGVELNVDYNPKNFGNIYYDEYEDVFGTSDGIKTLTQNIQTALQEGVDNYEKAWTQKHPPTTPTPTPGGFAGILRWPSKAPQPAPVQTPEPDQNEYMQAALRKHFGDDFAGAIKAQMIAGLKTSVVPQKGADKLIINPAIETLNNAQSPAIYRNCIGFTHQ